VFIARALAQNASILLMDEPFSGVDVPSQEAILDILDKLREQCVTVLVSTHDLNLAMERFDQLALLNHALIALGRHARWSLRPRWPLPTAARRCGVVKITPWFWATSAAAGKEKVTMNNVLDLLIEPLRYPFMVRGCWLR